METAKVLSGRDSAIPNVFPMCTLHFARRNSVGKIRAGGRTCGDPIINEI